MVIGRGAILGSILSRDFERMTKRVVIRVDATPELGAGHMIRMIALGQLLRDLGHAVHIATIGTDRKTLSALGITEFAVHRFPDGIRIGSVDDSAALRALVTELAADWVVLDGYAFETPYQRAIVSTGAQLMSVDDLANGHFVGDVVLNQNYGAETASYSTEPRTRKLLGPRYVLLRREFRTADPRLHPKNEPPAKFLVSLGGGTAAGLDALGKIARGLALVDQPGLCFRLVIGMLMEPTAELISLCESNPTRFQLVRHVENMSSEMGSADAAICSGGSTVWELMRMRVPFLAVALNPPQVGFLEILSRDGLCVNLGSHETLDEHKVRAAVQAFIDDRKQRAALVRAAEGLIDPELSGRAIGEIFGGQGSNSAM
jgi:UDP-2,4-diacetamido-2,4,6-trideoxy-beta-L-altropyranose hydrolase